MNILKRILGKQRAVTTVASWDGSPSRWPDTESYCASSLLDLNSAAGRTEKAQTHCMLPVKPPGSSSMADKAIFAAAGGRGITAVKKPSDVPQAAWDAAVKKAANTIISAYNELDRQAPDSVYELAGKEPPMERALMFDQVAQQLQEWTFAEPDRPYFMTFYLEQGQLYGLFNDGGQLSRAGIDVDADGQTLMVGDMEPVIHQFSPVSRSGFFIVRQADGRTRFFMIAATAIINRVGEIDSTALFDDMIRRAEESGFYPKLDFYHLGEVHSSFEFGQFDFLARDGVVYVGSGLFDEGHPIAIAAERTLRKNAAAWGASIEYYRPQNRGIEYVDLGNGLEIAAYTEGLNTRISLLPEKAAAAWFTGVIAEKRNMDERKLKALRDLFGEDEAGYNALVAKLTTVNTEVRDKGLVFREADNTEAETATDDAETETADETQDTVIELDDAAIAEIVKVARTQFENEVLVTVTNNLNTITGNLAKLVDGQAALQAAFNGMQERIATLEQSDEEKQRTWLSDLPARVQGQTRVTYRPRTEHSADPDVELGSEVQASKVLNGLPKVGFNR